jgi:hypothetical protein
MRRIAAILAVCQVFAISASAQTSLAPVISGLTFPVFVGHAGDGSNRLFIVEQLGTIRVMQQGSSSAETFLDIRPRVLGGGERGLLGLAFHPQYAVNRRFFVYYTRIGDGTLVIAEYRESAQGSNVADPEERIFLTIPHGDFANHNGGMVAFGPDGFLYIGTGDGGSGNDPPNNAQNIESLLGKMLRIDVNQANPAAGTAYSIPPDNPFVGRTGRDEIFAVGLRNPWRFSFDRISGQQWAADVGQSAREEVNSPVVRGGNYGWRVFEGSQCTNIDSGLCDTGSYIPPVFDYTRVNGRCSITGGYAYRGTLGTLQAGTYVYGDYCSGEILVWDGGSQAVLFDTAMNISSFGEDQFGEIYVVNHLGTISRIVSDAPCSYTVAPARVTLRPGATGTLTVSAGAGCGWTATPQASWITITSGASGSGTGVVTFSVASNRPRNRGGTIVVAGQTFTVR